MYEMGGKRTIMSLGGAAGSQIVVQFMQIVETNLLIPRSSSYSMCRVERRQGVLKGTSEPDDRED